MVAYPNFDTKIVNPLYYFISVGKGVLVKIFLHFWFATVERASGAVSHPVGSVVQSQGVFRTGFGARAELRFNDGSLVRIGGRSSFTVCGRGVFPPSEVIGIQG